MVKDDRCAGRIGSPAQLPHAPPSQFAHLWVPQHPQMRDRDRFGFVFGQLIRS